MKFLIIVWYIVRSVHLIVIIRHMSTACNMLS